MDEQVIFHRRALLASAIATLLPFRRPARASRLVCQFDHRCHDR